MLELKKKPKTFLNKDTEHKKNHMEGLNSKNNNKNLLISRAHSLRASGARDSIVALHASKYTVIDSNIIYYNYIVTCFRICSLFY